MEGATGSTASPRCRREPSGKRRSVQMFSLDFSDALMGTSAAASGAARADGSLELGATGLDTINPTLRLFEICSPTEESVVQRAALEKSLRRHISEEAAQRVLELVDDVERRSGMASTANQASLVQYITYWYALDEFFDEMGASPQPLEASDSAVDRVQCMRRFRDGVLELSSQDANGRVSSDTLFALLLEVREEALDKRYWDEIMMAIPPASDVDYAVRDISKAMHKWLKDFTGLAECDAEEQWPEEGGQESQQAGERGCPCDKTCAATHRSRSSNGSENGGDDAPACLREAFALVEKIGCSIAPGDGTAVHDSLAKLALALEAVDRHISGLTSQAVEVAKIQEANRALTEQASALDADLKQARNAQLGFSTLEQDRDDQKWRSELLEKELRSVCEERDATKKQLEDIQQQAFSLYLNDKKQISRDSMLSSQDSSVETASTMAPSSRDSEQLEQQLRLHKLQVQRLRDVRDKMLAINVDEDTLLFHEMHEMSGEDLSLRHLQEQRRNVFLSKQVKMLLKHTQAMECLLDEFSIGSEGSPTAERPSVQHFSDECSEHFESLAAELHTIEVEKADLERELQHSQRRSNNWVRPVDRRPRLVTTQPQEWSPSSVRDGAEEEPEGRDAFFACDAAPQLSSSGRQAGRRMVNARRMMTSVDEAGARAPVSDRQAAEPAFRVRATTEGAQDTGFRRTRVSSRVMIGRVERTTATNPRKERSAREPAIQTTQTTHHRSTSRRERERAKTTDDGCNMQ